MSRIAQVQGSGGLATITITGITGKSTRIYGWLTAANTTAAMTVLPSVTVSNCLDYTGTTFTYAYAEAEGGGVANLARGLRFLPGREYELYGSLGTTMVVIHHCGRVDATPYLYVWFDQVGGP